MTFNNYFLGNIFINFLIETLDKRDYNFFRITLFGIIWNNHKFNKFI